MSIGTVLDELRPEFPEITISKIRFLESEGLVRPARTAAGYRQFSSTDVDRLRFVLTAQRDHYLPLKVIRDQLDAIGRGMRPATPSPRLPGDLDFVVPGLPSAADFAPSPEVRLTRAEFLAETGIADGVLTELQEFGMIRPSTAGFYDADSVAIGRTAAALTAFGIEPRHLRAFRTAADREVGLLAQIVTPLARQRDAAARTRADETASELAALSVRLHTLLVKVGLRGILGG